MLLKTNALLGTFSTKNVFFFKLRMLINAHVYGMFAVMKEMKIFGPG